MRSYHRKNQVIFCFLLFLRIVRILWVAQPVYTFLYIVGYVGLRGFQHSWKGNKRRSKQPFHQQFMFTMFEAVRRFLPFTKV